MKPSSPKTNSINNKQKNLTFQCEVAQMQRLGEAHNTNITETSSKACNQTFKGNLWFQGVEAKRCLWEQPFSGQQFMT